MNREFISQIISSALPVFEHCLVLMASNAELPKLVCRPTQPTQKLKSTNPLAQDCFQGFNSQPQLLFKNSPQNTNRIPVQNRSSNKTEFPYCLSSLHTWALHPWPQVLLWQLMEGEDRSRQGCKTKVSSRWCWWKPLNPFSMGEKPNMFCYYWILLKFTQQIWHWHFTASKWRSCYCVWIGPWDDSLIFGSECLGGSERPNDISPLFPGHWFQSNFSLGVRIS